jgi:hypothetical protein
MRPLVVTLSLAMIVALLVGALVTIGGVRVSEPLLVMLGGGLFMVAVLFAAISAIGPKFRPTPALTPIMAGTGAATFSAALILAAHLHLSTGQAASFRASEPQRPAPEATEPVPEARTVEPELPEPPPDAFAAVPPTGDEAAGDIPMDDVPMDEPPAEDFPMDVPPGEEPSTTAALPSASTEPATEASPSAGDASTVTVPIPVPRPRSPSETPEKLGPGETFTLSDQPFDSSTITAAPRAPQAARITPPLPRSRPCGAGGPPCP